MFHFYLKAKRPYEPHKGKKKHIDRKSQGTRIEIATLCMFDWCESADIEREGWNIGREQMGVLGIGRKRIA